MDLLNMVHRVIDLARAIPRKPACARDDPFGGIWDMELAACIEPPSPQELELRQYLLSQPPAVLRGVEAIMYLGRDYEPLAAEEELYGADCDDFDFLDAYEHLTDVSHGARADVDHLLGKPLAMYLEWGLERARERGIEVAGLLG